MGAFRLFHNSGQCFPLCRFCSICFFNALACLVCCDAVLLVAFANEQTMHSRGVLLCDVVTKIETSS